MSKLAAKPRDALPSHVYRQFAKFILVGCINTAIYYSIFIIMIRKGFFYIVAITAGTIIGVINSYIWNKFFTFKCRKKSAGEIAKFITVYVIQYASNILIVYICIVYLNVSVELSGLIATTICVFISFFGHKFWSFRSMSED